MELSNTIVILSSTSISESSNPPLVLQLLVVLADEVAANARLEVGDDLRQAIVAPLLQLAEDACFEEHLRVSETVVVAEVQRRQYLLGGHLAVDEAGRDDVRRQD